MQRLTRNQMAARLARDILPGSYVNIGIGMPELVANYLKAEDEILLHSENGILGMGRPPQGTTLMQSSSMPAKSP